MDECKIKYQDIVSGRSILWTVHCILCISLSSLQPNVDTRQKQLAAWCSLALSYCRHHKLYTLDVLEAQESPVFNNKKIERILTRPMYILYIRPDRKPQVALLSIDLNWTPGKLSMEAIQVVFEELRKKGKFIPFICWFADDIGVQVCVFWHQGTWSGWIRTSRGV